MLVAIGIVMAAILLFANLPNVLLVLAALLGG
jgi:hypothetical protein